MQNTTNQGDSSQSQSDNTNKVATFERILLVEDNYIAQKATKFTLEHFKCAIDVAASGAEAISLATSNRYDIILMDIGLPDTDGFEVTAKIREHEAESNLPHTPIFALTAHTDPIYKKRCLRAGVDEVLFKPLLQQHKQAILDRYHELTSPQEAQEQNLPDIDWGQADKLANNDRMQAKHLLRQLAEELPHDKIAITQTFEQQHIDTLNDQLHRLHGALCYVGTPALKFALYELQTSVSKNDLSMEKFQRFIAAIDSLLSTIHISLSGSNS